jgi:hypothetical protein
VLCGVGVSPSGSLSDRTRNRCLEEPKRCNFGNEWT